MKKDKYNTIPLEHRPEGGFRKNLSEYIMYSGMSTSKIAEKIGITRSAMCRYKNGTRSPSPSVLVMLARELGITVDDLLAGEEYELEDYIPRKTT